MVLRFYFMYQIDFYEVSVAFCIYDIFFKKLFRHIYKKIVFAIVDDPGVYTLARK